MDSIKRLVVTHPLIFTLIGIAILIDVTGIVAAVLPGHSFALGSLLVVAYFLGVSSVLRFGIVRKRVHLAVAWILIIVMYLGWFLIQALLENKPYRPSFLFFVCVLAAFKTMRLVSVETVPREV